MSEEENFYTSIIEFDYLKDYSLICGITTKPYDMNIETNPEKATEYRNLLLKKYGVRKKNQAIFCKQTHSKNVVNIFQRQESAILSKSSTSEFENTDGLITNSSNLFLCIQIADCLPIYLFAPDKNVISLLHSGWRGTKSGILKEAIRLIEREYDTSCENFYMILGPSIKGCCYEVSSDFNQYFDNLILRNNKYYLDLAEYSKKTALELGIKKSNIFDTEICTYCNHNLYYSYRFEKNKSGRMIAFCKLNQNK